ncbi:alpha/beta fold hydrolase [Aerococcaceae bacterium zg-ZJ1578]|uniref:alpha/beta hydrolase family protein n=1 Tax=Aerococcaceae bacterium zg-252 TaxID=2796928 RepID=UPI001A26DFEB|nr:alpha/beta fold hydrolase [Aerococcaceae bacterium zg-1578]
MYHNEIILLESNVYNNRYSYVKKCINGDSFIYYSQKSLNRLKKIKWEKRDDIICMKWIKHCLLIQCRYKIYIFSPEDERIEEFKNIQFIIYRILNAISLNELICETIDNKLIYVFLERNITVEIAAIEDGIIKIKKKINSHYEKNAIKKILSFRNNRIKSNDLSIYYNKEQTIISYSGRKIKIFGFIESFIRVHNTVLFLISSFKNAGRIFSWDELVNDLDLRRKPTFHHKYINDIPVYDNEFVSTTCLFLIHGGPESHYLPIYDYLIDQLEKLKSYRIVLVNYVGSTGYGLDYQKKIYNNGGITDLASIISVIEEYSEEKIIIGESYGGYLSILTALKSNIKLKKVVSINGFTDIYTQSNFSVIRNIMYKYFDIENKFLISGINPLSIVEGGKNPNCQVVFIHSIRDSVCPIIQIRKFVNSLIKMKCNSYELILTDVTHQQFNLNEREKITRILIKSLKEE